VTDRPDLLLDYDVVDVFAGRAFEGNPLAVVHGSQGLDDAALQALAREFNLSETVFPTRVAAPAVDADGDRFGMRIFTPTTELPFAGHPSIGAAWALRARGLATGPRVRLDAPAGAVRVVLGERAGDLTWLTGLAPHLGGELESAGVLAAVGLGEHDLVGLETHVAGCGLDFCYLFVRPGAIARAVPDLQGLRRLRWQGTRLGGVAVVGWHGDTARVRVFTDDIGSAEDPATGSAALGLAVAAVRAGLVAADGESRFTVTQGIELGRPSTLHCVVEADAGVARVARVGGGVVARAAGRVRRP
jgi:trans-2,3-dihydro-3-hydroxyanthranilate isomerase